MKKIIIYLISALLISSFYISYRVYSIFFKPNTNSEFVLYVYPNHNSDSIINNLLKDSTIINSRSFRTASSILKFDFKIKPGRYIIKESINNKNIIDIISRGLQTPHNLVLSGNIRTLDRLSSIISTRIMEDSLSVLKTLTDSTLIQEMGFDKYTIRAMFLLNTYEIYWTTSSTEILRRFKREYDNFWTNKRLEQAKALNLTPIEVITLASIVSEESNLSFEHPIIAGVYLNRLRIGMPLQADPTIKYALNDPTIKRILFAHLEIDSPYNTYKKRGLPPGPITIVSPRVIDAVLNYTNHQYLYFCAHPSLNGSHSFAKTLKEHNANARQYHQALNRLNHQNRNR